MSGTPHTTIDALHRDYRSGDRTPADVVESVLPALEADPYNAWVATRDPEQLRSRAREVETSMTLDGAPLYGVPFAVKDNIDAEGLSTTAGCPEYAYEPDEDATVVERLRAAGALLVGKTNMDQFATGLVGTRSPYGPCRNPFQPEYVSGGSSSGSAVAVATGVVSFALGTDTAGSGRVPASMNNVVGLKPTRGILSTDGVVPACRTLDCVAVFALTAADALAVERVAAGHDPADPYSRRNVADLDLALPAPPDSVRVGVPADDHLEFFGAPDAPDLFREAVERLEAVGGTAVEVDFTPFREAAQLLYEGPWVAERLAAVREFLEANPDAVYPVTRQIIERGADYSAVDTFEAMYELKRLERTAAAQLRGVDCLVTPTAGPAYRIDEVRANPVELNSNLGYYTNYVNLLGLSAVAVPAGFRSSGVPFGVTLVGAADEEAFLSGLAAAVAREGDGPPPGVPGDSPGG